MDSTLMAKADWLFLETLQASLCYSQQLDEVSQNPLI